MENKAQVKATVLAETTKAWDGSSLPGYPTGNPQIIIKRFSFPPNTVTDWHYHPVINAGLVISGQLTIVCKDGEERTFYAGDAIVEITGKAHRGENRSDETADLVIVYASTPGEPLAINE